MAGYMITNGLSTWLPTIYRSLFNVPLKTSLGYAFFTAGCGLVGSICCALYVDRVGRKRWYIAAFFGAVIPLVALAVLGAKSAMEVLTLVSCAYAMMMTITFSLYLYTAELYPTHMRALGVGTGSAFLRIGSTLSPLLIGTIVAHHSVSWVFWMFGLLAIVGGVITSGFAIESKGRVLEELSPDVATRS
jgi:putative MFS transporter